MAESISKADSTDLSQKAVLADSTRGHQVDKWIHTDVSNASLKNQLFVRLIVKGRRFENVDFKYSIFDTSYLRDCVFDACDFTGCRFIGTNLHGSKFSGCVFDYATFERTTIDPEVLDTECPAFENLKMRFARSLRVNYEQLGDAGGANKAVAVELDAEEVHLHKSWRSNDRYYRKKYQGWDRFVAFHRWMGFRILDFIWGNGESPIKFLRFLLIIIGALALTDTLAFRDPILVNSYGVSLLNATPIFLGVLSPAEYPTLLLALITFTRLLMIGFFLSILIRRFNRR